MKRYFYSVLGLLLYGSALSAECAPECNPCPCPCPCWTSVYVGWNGGWGWTSAKYSVTPFGTTTIADFPAETVSNPLNGPLFGGQIGFNWQVCNWVLGVEGDFDGVGINGWASRFFLSGDDTGGTNASAVYADLDWMATVRGRLGMTLEWCGCGLLYLTGGAAWGHLKTGSLIATSEVADGGFGDAVGGKFSKTKAGWVVGAGYEHRIASRWSVRAEYLYAQFKKGPTTELVFPNSTDAVDTATVSIGNTHVNCIRLGVNYIYGFSNWY